MPVMVAQAVSWINKKTENISKERPVFFSDADRFDLLVLRELHPTFDLSLQWPKTTFRNTQSPPPSGREKPAFS